MEQQPVTEAANPITADIDVANAHGIVKLLGQCDAEIFCGWRLYKSLYDPEVTVAVEQVANIASNVIKNDKGMIILSGCGTSGRLGFITARTFNHILSKTSTYHDKFHYTIAGGDRALLLSTEAPEDSWASGIHDLAKISDVANCVLYIGITCGLSAPYVAGQLNYCLTHSNKFTCVLVGFNPIQLARKSVIDNWDKTFFDVATKIERLSESSKSCFIINPVVGPEQITGSTRMKSGSATKMLIETIFYLAVSKSLTESSQNMAQQECAVQKLFQAYEFAFRETYLHSADIATFVERAGYSLCNGGHVFYLGANNMGIMSVIDASECPPTYGSSYDDVRGFLNGGWATLGNSEGELASKGHEYQLSIEYFKDCFMHSLTETDTIFMVTDDIKEFIDFNHLLKEFHLKKCYVGIITTGATDKKHCDSDQVTILLTDSPVVVISEILSSSISSKLIPYFMTSLCEVSTKWILNAISTGSHILKGKVLSNRMVDLQVSNSKLYYRAIGIIQKFASVDASTAEQNLLVSIYGYIPAETTIDQHIQRATRQEMVVPRAILMASSGCTLNEACHKLQTHPIIRKVLVK